MAPGAGEAVGSGVQMVEQAKAGCDDWKKTKADRRATPAMAATTTIAVR